MKRIFFPLLLLTLASCAREKLTEDPSSPGEDPIGDCIAISASLGTKVSVDTEWDDSTGRSVMSWEKGDLIRLVHDGAVYEYVTEDSGQEAVFYPADAANALRKITEGKPLNIYYNEKSLLSGGKAGIAVYDSQEEGKSSGKVTLCSSIASPVPSEGKIRAVFSPLTSVLEFNIKSPMSLVVDRVVFTPGGLEKGFTVMSDGIYDPSTSVTVAKDSSSSAISLKLSARFNLIYGRSFKFLVAPFRTDGSVSNISFYNGSELVYSKDIWSGKKIDLTGSPVHFYQALQVGAKDTRVRTTHPRLFFNSDDIPAIKAAAAGKQSKELSLMRKRIDDIINLPITFPDSLAATGESNTNHEYGFRASDAAMLWVVTGEKQYLEFAKKLLTRLSAYYKLRNDNNLNITWYNFSTICSLCAYDWIYNSLSATERQTIGAALYDAVYNIAWHTPSTRKQRYREDVSDHQSGCYGTNFIPWYLAIAFCGDGIADGQCLSMYESGYQLYEKMVSFRASMAGTEGGAATSCPNYSLSTYPLADFNFIRTLKAATGYDISESLVYVFKYLDYINWNTLPGNLEFGAGDTNHYTCKLATTDIHHNLEELASIYAQAHSEALPEIARLLKVFPQQRAVERFPFIRLLQGVELPEPSERPATGDAVYLKNMGQAFLRSGVGDDDTYALFTCGGVNTQHKHYDNNNFVIYKKGYRALDTGTRPEPGLHLPYYYARTVAHNCVTVRMPGESMPKYWGSAAPGESSSTPIPNDGGQNNVLGSVMKSFRNEADYVAISSDATPCYNASKISLVEREFIWLKPDVFIVFDRVESKDASYPKTWLFHTAAEPVLSSGGFSEESSGGKTVCRTLYPADAVISKTGGDGRQFWSDGRNWPIPADRAATIPPDDWPQLGQWRVEITPGTPALRDCFLNLIMVGNASLSGVPEATLTEKGDALTLRLKYGGKNWAVSFDKSASYGCSVSTPAEPFNDYSFIQGEIE